MARTNVAVEESVAYMLADEAARQNKTLYAFTNELMKTSLRICREGGNLNEIYPAWRFAKMTREVDTVPLPGDLLEKMIARLSTLDEGWLLKTWHEEGVRIGTYLHMYEPTFERLSAFVKEMEFLLPIKRLDILKVEKQEAGRYIVRAIGAGLSPSSTKCAEALLQGLLSTYSITVISSRISEGIIELTVESMQPTGKA
jgi:hypothetical protein